MTKPVLYTVGGHTQRELWQPLSEHYQLAFLNSGAGRMAAEMGVEDVLLIESFMTPTMLEQAKRKAMLHVAQVADVVASGSCLFDPSIPSLDTQGMLNWLPVWTYENLIPAIGRAFSLAACHEKHGGVGALVHEDVTPEGRILCQWANAEGLPTLHMPHANHFLANDTEDIHCSTVARHIGASGTYMRDWYAGAGAQADIQLIGAPQWDRLYDTERRPGREFARRALGLPQDGLVLAYATTWAQMTAVWGKPDEELERGLELMLGAAKELAATLIIKMHPGEVAGQEKAYVEALREFGLKGAITRKHNEVVLRAADCLITQGSTNLAVSAAILGTPVVEIYQCSTRYPDYGPPGTWGEELVDLIREAVRGQDLGEFERAMNYDADGKAGERAVAWIRELCP